MNPESYYKRLDAAFRPAVLRSKRVVIAGAGSGGGRVATDLGRLGVNLLLIDRPGEQLEEHNILRHVLSYRSLGRLKVSELASHINGFNPQCPVDCAEIDISAEPERFAAAIRDFRADLILACVDNEDAKHTINQVALAAGVPTIGAGVYDGGIGGEVYLVRPGGACYACIADHLQRTRRAPQKKLEIDYSNPDVEEARSTCAINIDIDQIALIHTRMALAHLLGAEVDVAGVPPAVNLIAFANRPVPGVTARPLHAEFYAIPVHDACLVCARSNEDIAAQAAEILRQIEPTR